MACLTFCSSDFYLTDNDIIWPNNNECNPSCKVEVYKDEESIIKNIEGKLGTIQIFEYKDGNLIEKKIKYVKKKVSKAVVVEEEMLDHIELE